MAEAAFDGLEEASDLRVIGGELDLDELVLLFRGAVGFAVCFVVEKGSDFLGETVADLAQLAMRAVDLVRIFAIGADLGVDFKVVGGPRLVDIDWPADGADRVLEEADHALLLGARGGLGVDDGRHGVLAGEGRHDDDDGSLLQYGFGW